jgi:putative ABC transport system permease protein
VVGIVENPAALSEDFVLVPPHAPGPDDQIDLLVRSARDNGPPGPPAAGSGQPVGFRVEVVDDPHQAVAALVLVVAALAMALVGLIASASFVVMAQRRQRQLGLLAAIGATDRHLRLTMIATGAIIGMVAAVGGAVLGVTGWLVAAPAVEQAANHRIDRFDLPWNLIVGCLVLAVVAGMAAAWWPARLQARVPVVAALSRRPPRPAPVHRSLTLGGALLAAGVAGIWAARPTGDVRPLLLMASVLAEVLGVVLAAPTAVRLLGLPAARLPLAGRVALRDLLRQQSRAAAALAAVTLGLGISISIVGVAAANQSSSDAGNLSDRQLLVHASDFVTAAQAATDPAARARLSAAAERVGRGFEHEPLLELDVATNPETLSQPDIAGPIDLTQQTSSHSFRFVGTAYVATPAVLARLHVDPADISPSTDVVTSRTGPHLVLLDASARDGQRATRIQHLPLSAYTSGPTTLITEAALARRGWIAAPHAWLLEARHPLTAAQVRDARTTAASAGLEVEVRDHQDGLAALRRTATGVGMALALAIVAMTVGLLRGESAAEVRTLEATGARTRTLRAITAWSAGALTVGSVALSLVGAYAALAAAYHAQLDRLVPLPLGQLLPVAVGLPLAAALGGWLLAGRDPKRLARAALD